MTKLNNFFIIQGVSLVPKRAVVKPPVQQLPPQKALANSAQLNTSDRTGYVTLSDGRVMSIGDCKKLTVQKKVRATASSVRGRGGRQKSVETNHPMKQINSAPDHTLVNERQNSDVVQHNPYVQRQTPQNILTPPHQQQQQQTYQQPSQPLFPIPKAQIQEFIGKSSYFVNTKLNLFLLCRTNPSRRRI